MADAGAGALKVLLVNPRFNGDSFWAYKPACRLVGAKYPAPSLGLLTVAAMLPAHWEIRYFDRNVIDSEAEFDRLLDWADLMLTSGMLPQQIDHFRVIEQAKASNVLTVVGGPDASSSPHLYRRADFRVVGEAEGCIDALIAAIERGERGGEFHTPMGSVDVTQSPIPRFDLLDFASYLEITVQFSRGCPFRCEFCDIIELYGRMPRAKTNAQMLAELHRLYELGYRGGVEFADDNLIGNKKAVKAFLKQLVAWQRAHNYPFGFTTESSLNLADDPEMLELLRDCNFIGIFIGIESPDPDVLAMAQKKQNMRRDIVENVHRIQAAGIFVVAGFIVGFDNERSSVADSMVDLIESAAIPIATVGLLYALPNTQLTNRLARERRLHALHDVAPDDGGGDQCTQGLNFDTIRPRQEVLSDYRNIVARIYAEDAYFDRVRRAVDRLDMSGANGSTHVSTLGLAAGRILRFLWSISFQNAALRRPVWRLLAYVLRRNPRALQAALLMAAFYAHLGPYARLVVDRMDKSIAEAEAAPTREAAQPGQKGRASLAATLEKEPARS